MKKNNFGKRSGLTIMRKILVILIISFIATLTYCANEPEDKDKANNPTNQTQEKATFSPPSWIMGAWFDSVEGITWVFSTNDIMHIINGMTTNLETHTVTEKMSTGTSYTLEITVERGGQTITAEYKFDKMAGNNQLTRTLTIRVSV